VTLPPDGHTHSEWSWDAPLGSMERSCARAVELGLPAIAFTEHLDHTVWPVVRDGPLASDHLTALAGPDGLLRPPAFDPQGYLEAVQRCRERYPDLRILSGVEMGEPHRHADACAAVLRTGRFDRVLGSVHCLPDGDGWAEAWTLYSHGNPATVIRRYLDEVVRLVTECDLFTVLAHIDYPIRTWPEWTAGPFDPAGFEPEFRHALRATASAGRILEINTRIPLHPDVVAWWHDEGGEAVTFGSDAHHPPAVGHGFRAAADMAEALGFRPGPDPFGPWTRVARRRRGA
jgi:histidinol-phosphatase (PHP family)